MLFTYSTISRDVDAAHSARFFFDAPRDWRGARPALLVMSQRHVVKTPHSTDISVFAVESALMGDHSVGQHEGGGIGCHRRVSGPANRAGRRRAL